MRRQPYRRECGKYMRILTRAVMYPAERRRKEAVSRSGGKHE